MTAISNKNIAEAIYLTTEGGSHLEQPLIFKKVIQFLVKRRLLRKAPDILLHLNKIINDREGRVIAKVSSKNNLSGRIKQELTHLLAKHYSAKEITLVSNLDEKLLGGFKIEVNDEVIDLTIKNKISKLEEYLTKNV
jgi:F-type H+-transporting ATPase subunit delta